MAQRTGNTFITAVNSLSSRVNARSINGRFTSSFPPFPFEEGAICLIWRESQAPSWLRLGPLCQGLLANGQLDPGRSGTSKKN